MAKVETFAYVAPVPDGIWLDQVLWLPDITWDPDLANERMCKIWGSANLADWE